MALAEALERTTGKRVMVYMDSQLVFTKVHIHGAIYRKCGFLSSERQPLKNIDTILRLVDTMEVHLPKAVAVAHIPRHQRSTTMDARSDEAAGSTSDSKQDSHTFCLSRIALPRAPTYFLCLITPQRMKKKAIHTTAREWGKDEWGKDK